MRSFLKTIITAVCGLLAILMIVAVLVLGYKNIHALIHGVINISLILEFIGSAVIFAILIGICKAVEQSPYFAEYEITVDDVQKEVDRQKAIESSITKFSENFGKEDNDD